MPLNTQFLCSFSCFLLWSFLFLLFWFACPAIFKYHDSIVFQFRDSNRLCGSLLYFFYCSRVYAGNASSQWIGKMCASDWKITTMVSFIPERRTLFRNDSFASNYLLIGVWYYHFICTKRSVNLWAFGWYIVSWVMIIKKFDFWTKIWMPPGAIFSKKVGDGPTFFVLRKNP